MVTQATAARIWNAYREIDAAEKLLNDIAEERANIERQRPNAFRREQRDIDRMSRNVEMAIPTSESSARLFQVSDKLAESVIRAHIADCLRELTEANEQARLEVETPTP